MQLEKVYEPGRFEPHWAQWWIESGIYRADAKKALESKAKSAPVFSMVIPPPNVTGSPHIGHLFEHTMSDVAVRWHRMRGEMTLWLPGTDHAGISTQMVVERQLATEGIKRQDLGREEFERRVWQWKEEYGGRIQAQIRREGASVDWSRERFTLDAGLSRAVRENFVHLWTKGLVYRGEYIVNWCPRCQTALSDLETIHESVEGHLWHVRYKVSGSDETLVVATTRPETMLGDTALAVHPEDSRYRHLQGKTAILPLLNREIPIVADSMVDPKFGTGVVKVTPAHDPNDFAVAKRHNLPFIKVIDENARMTAAAGPYADLDRFEARKRVLAALEQTGELVKTESYTVNVAKCERCRTIIEPLVSMQWFVHMKPLAEKAMEAVRQGRIRFVPTDREPLFFQWMENIRDWCISRQLWWGHRIPAWHCKKCAEIIVAREAPATCPRCHSTEIEQDTDVLDTWFSSGLWPFSTLGWPDQTEDLAAFYPTSLLITGFDILFFWVSRMIMLGLELTGDVPFREIHIHGLVRDADKQKMSKTKGNVIDPLVIIDKYGTDAVRIALLLSAAAGSDIALKEDRMESGRMFANKIWNASRLLFMNMERSGIDSWSPSVNLIEIAAESTEDAWVLERLLAAINAVNRALELHRYHDAAQTLWDFVWREFCDWYLEVKKLRFREASGLDSHWRAALTVYETALRLLHPFMPFVTEELWQRLVHGGSAQTGQPISISLASFPVAVAGGRAPDGRIRLFELMQQIVTAARELRADHKIEPKTIVDATVYLRDAVLGEADLAAAGTLAKIRIEQRSGAISDHAGFIRSMPDFDLQLHFSNRNGAANAESRARAQREIAALEKAIQHSKRQLADPTFLSKAPERIVANLRAKVAEYEEQVAAHKRLLDG
jgi:valyl-tRNA synthetase